MKKTMVKMAVAVLLTAVLAIPSGVWAGPEQWPAKIRLGLIPTEGGSETKERFEPLVKHLEKCLGIEVEAVSASDYAVSLQPCHTNIWILRTTGPRATPKPAEKANAEAPGHGNATKKGSLATMALSLPARIPALKIWKTPGGGSSPLPIPTRPRASWYRTSFLPANSRPPRKTISNRSNSQAPMVLPSWL